MSRLAIESLAIRGLRNLASVDLRAGPRFNVIAGENGQGKTNLLEAIYALATSKSFRASKPGDLVAHGGEIASVRAIVRHGEDAREQSVGLKAGARVVRLDGKRPPTLAAYAVEPPVVVVHPGEVALSTGGGGERRRLLDRIALYVSAGSMEELESFTRAIRERQRALDTRGVAARDLEHWEQLAAQHGARVMRARREAAARLIDSATLAFAKIAAPGLDFVAAYAPSAPEDETEFASALATRRPHDLRRGGASIGPHRDDLRIEIGGYPVRGIASQGQHRAVVLALKSAEMAAIGAARETTPILLLDDVSSELDRARTAALFAFLQEQHGQIFLTTTRPELIDTGPLNRTDERRDFLVVSGQISASATS
jgi:DNA replication and repair protein RecF